MIEARAQRKILIRHFFGGFFDNDLISPGSDLHGVLSKFAAILVLPGVLFPFSLVFKYGYPFRTYEQLELASWSDKSIFVSLSLIVMGLLTVMEWDSLQLDRRDSCVFGVLPIKGRTILEAKLGALGIFLLLGSGGLAALGAVSFPLIMHARWPASLAAVGASVAGHVAATMGAAAFVFFSLLTLHGLMQIVLGPAAFRRASALIQMVATFVLAAALLMLPFIASSTAALKSSTAPLAGLAPQMWFVGIYETVSGNGDAEWNRLAVRGIIALTASAIAGLAATLLAYRRLLSRAVDAVQAGRPSRSFGARIYDMAGGLIARNPAERGFFSFSVATLFRSAWHRITLAAFLGIALALSMAALDLSTYTRDGHGRVPIGEAHLLFVQLLITSITVAGVRAAAASPAELKASWMLQMTDTGDSSVWLNGFRKAAMAAVIVPLAGAMTLFVWIRFGWDVAWPHAVAQLLFAAIMMEVLLLGFGRVPFACPFDGATGSVKVRWLMLIAFLTTFLFPVSRLIVSARTAPVGAAVLMAFGLLVVAWLRISTSRALTRAGLRFEAEDTDSTQALGLSQ